jgi:NAD(P)-dependent dehydrogenase (short-subunit alcohol dehydrogenase family)
VDAPQGLEDLAELCLLEGISDTLSKALAPFGIAVTAVAPGSFRTDWARRSIGDDDASFEPVRRARIEKSGKQPGDPARAAQAILRLVGGDALALVRAALAERLAQIDAWKAVTRSTGGWQDHHGPENPA